MQFKYMNKNSWRLLICLLFMVLQWDSCSHKFTHRRQTLLLMTLFLLFITYGSKSLKKLSEFFYFNHYC